MDFPHLFAMLGVSFDVVFRLLRAEMEVFKNEAEERPLVPGVVPNIFTRKPAHLESSCNVVAHARMRKGTCFVERVET